MNYYKLNILIDAIVTLVAYLILFYALYFQIEYIFAYGIKIAFFYLILTQLTNYIIKRSWYNGDLK